jgi:hypothetical protein
LSCKRVVFFPDHPVKTHFIHPDALEITLADIKSRNDGATPTEIHDEDVLRIDPGGMINTRAVPLTKDFGGCTVSVNPEHVVGAVYRWSKTRDLDEAGTVVRVYMSDWICLGLPKSLHEEIGAWLYANQVTGLMARQELAEVLKGKVIIPTEAEEALVFPNKSKEVH